uniref:Uncharacterized protein n=1 Tax=Siphoviridae sp. ctk4d14 TaxID=2825639 RepID=A0A8S5QK29_9CAUD|nr:MAG TPA: hypothetical protein [Siphoviridae sp. ctk4d14]
MSNVDIRLKIISHTSLFFTSPKREPLELLT